MTATFSVPRTTLTFTPTRAQVDACRRYGIRVTPLDGTTKLLTRVCPKCQRVEEREVDIADTPRNRWETNQALEKLSGDGWRCAACRLTALPLPTHRASGGGNGGGSRKRRPSTHKSYRTRRPSIRQLREVLDYYQDALEMVVTGEVVATPAQINRWTAYRNEAQAALRERGVRV